MDLEGGDPLLKGNCVSSRADGLIMKGGDDVVFCKPNERGTMDLFGMRMI